MLEITEQLHVKKNMETRYGC